MKFVQRDMGKSSEASAGEGGQLRELGKLTLWALGLILAIYLIVGFVVDAVVPGISPETEAKLFGGFMPKMGVTAATSPEMQADFDRIEAILLRLSAHPDVPKLKYQVFIMPDTDPNAFAVPGGGIGVTQGLLDKLEDDVSLAFVLGHELGHFHQRDHLRGMGRGIGMSVCFAIIFGNSSGGDVLAGNTMTLMNRRYNRGQEDGADRFGVMLVNYAYGHTRGVERLFEILAAEDTLPRWAYMMSTHPDSGKRVEALRAYAAELNEIDNDEGPDE